MNNYRDFFFFFNLTHSKYFVLKDVRKLRELLMNPISDKYIFCYKHLYL